VRSQARAFYGNFVVFALIVCYCFALESGDEVLYVFWLDCLLLLMHLWKNCGAMLKYFLEIIFEPIAYISLAVS